MVMNPPSEQPLPPEERDDSIYDDDDLRCEEREAKVRDRYAEEDRKDRVGPHYLYR